MTHRFSGHDPQGGSDTGGVPWAGRTLTGTGFDDDDGTADATLARLLATPPELSGRPPALSGTSPELSEQGIAQHQAQAVAQREEYEIALVAAVAAARLIVPIVAIPGEIDDSSGIPADASSDMASVTLRAPDGQQALPAFTSTQALADWDASARPVPVTAQRAALAAVQEGCEVMPLDLPGSPGPAAYTLRPSMVWALAMARPWQPAHRDEHVRSAVAAALRELRPVTGHSLAGTEDGALEITLQLQPGLTREQLQALLQEVGQQLAADGETRARIDALTFRVVTG